MIKKRIISRTDADISKLPIVIPEAWKVQTIYERIKYQTIKNNPNIATNSINTFFWKIGVNHFFTQSLIAQSVNKVSINTWVITHQSNQYLGIKNIHASAHRTTQVRLIQKRIFCFSNATKR